MIKLSEIRKFRGRYKGWLDFCRIQLAPQYDALIATTDLMELNNLREIHTGEVINMEIG